MKKTLFFLLFSLCLTSSAFGQQGQFFNPMSGNFDGCINIREEDGSPNNITCAPLEVTNGTLTEDADGAFSLSITGGGATQLTELSDVASATLTSGNLLISDGSEFESVTMSGSCTITSNGAISCTGTGATQLDELGDVSSATKTSGNLLIADGTNYQAITLGGDATVTSDGTLTIGTGVIGTTEIATDGVQVAELEFLGSRTATAGNLLISSGTDFESVAMGGDCTVDSAGTMNCSGTLALTDLTDVGSSTQTSGNLLISDGSQFESVTASGSCTLTSAGVFSCSGGSVTALTDLSDVSSSTATAGNLLIADGTNFEAVVVGGDVTMGSDGAIQIASGVVGTTEIATDGVQVAELEFLGSRTATAGNILISDGTDFQSVVVGGSCTATSDGSFACSGASGDSILVDTSNPVDTTADLQSGGDIDFVFADGGAGGPDVVTANINAGAVNVDEIATDGVQLDELEFLGSRTATTGNLLISDGTDYQAITMGGECTITSAGAIDCTSDFGATIDDTEMTAEDFGDFTCSGGEDGCLLNTDSVQLNELEFLGSRTNTTGNLLISDGTDFQAITMGGDGSITSNGALVVNDDSHNHVITNIDSFTETELETQLSDVTALFTNNVTGDVTVAGSTSTIGAGVVNTDEIATDGVQVAELEFLGSRTATAGNLLIADGTDFQAVTASGSCTLTSAGVFSCSGAGALTDLSDVDSSTKTAGNLLIADGTNFESVVLGGDVSMGSNGVVAVSDDSHNHVITNIDSFTETQLETQLSDVTALFTNNVTGDVTVAGSTSTIGAGVVSTDEIGTDGVQLDELEFLGSRTATAGNLLISDGTDFQAVTAKGSCTLTSDGSFSCSGASGDSILIDTSNPVDTTADFQSGGDIDFVFADGGAGGPDTVTANINASAVSTDELANVGSVTATAGNLLIADGTDFEAVTLSSDCVLTSNGAIECYGNGASIGGSDLSDFQKGLAINLSQCSTTACDFSVFGGTINVLTVGSGTDTLTINGNLVFGSGSTADFSNVTISNFDATSLDGIGSRTVTAGNLLIMDGTDFESVVLGGDGTITSNGALVVADDSHNHVITNIDAFTETQLETQLSDVTALFTNNVTGDVTVAGATSTIGTNTVGTDEIDLSISPTWTGDHNFGGSTQSFEIPNGATVTDPNVAGEVAIDTTTGQFLWHDGTAQRVGVYEFSRCGCLSDATNITVRDNYPIFTAPANLTITAISAQGTGTSCTVDFEDDADTNIENAVACDVASPSTWDEAIAGTATIVKGEGVEFDVTASSAITGLCACVRYTIDAD